MLGGDKMMPVDLPVPDSADSHATRALAVVLLTACGAVVAWLVSLGGKLAARACLHHGRIALAAGRSHAKAQTAAGLDTRRFVTPHAASAAATLGRPAETGHSSLHRLPARQCGGAALDWPVSAGLRDLPVV